MVEDAMTVAVLVMLTFFSVLGTVGNSLVIYIYATKKEKSTAGIFIMSLAGTDLFTCFVIIPYTEAAIALEYRLMYDVVCKVYMFLITCNIPFSAFVMVAIAVDRYFCICRPFLHAINLWRAKCIVICLLMMASVLGILTALSHGVYVYGPKQHMPQNITPHFINNTDLFGYTEYNNHTNINISFIGQNGTHIADHNTTTLHIDSNASLEDSRTGQSDSGEGELELVYSALCQPNDIILGRDFSSTYQKLYAGCYLISFIFVLILYGLIYKSIHRHRAKKSKRKRSSLYPTGVEYSMAETQITAVTHVNPHGKCAGANGNAEETQPMQPRSNRKLHKPMSIKEKTLLANIRTAAMLFVVTVVFLVAFLPAWLMAIQVVTFNKVVFYMYFVYNAANPFIYAFMNKSFRDDLGKVMKCQSVPLVR